MFVYDRFSRTVINRNTLVYKSKKRLRSSSKKYDYKIKVALKQDLISGSWTLSILEGTHNHESSTAPAAHPAYRIAALDSEIIAQIKTLSAAGLAPGSILSVVREQFPHAILVQKDISNIIQKERIEKLGGRTPMQ